MRLGNIIFDNPYLSVTNTPYIFGFNYFPDTHQQIHVSYHQTTSIVDTHGAVNNFQFTAPIGGIYKVEIRDNVSVTSMHMRLNQHNSFVIDRTKNTTISRLQNTPLFISGWVDIG